jgi:hypothetical protein
MWSFENTPWKYEKSVIVYERLSFDLPPFLQFYFDTTVLNMAG